MAVYKFTAADRTAMATALRTAWNNQSGTGPCTLKFYAGAIIADPTVAITTQTLLGTLTCDAALGTEAGGVLTFSNVTQDSAADNGGTAAFAVLVDGSGAQRAVFDVSATGGTGAIKLNTVTIVAGGPIAMNSLTVTLGGA